jgi:hypothetical protein
MVGQLDGSCREVQEMSGQVSPLPLPPEANVEVSVKIPTPLNITSHADRHRQSGRRAEDDRGVGRAAEDSAVNRLFEKVKEVEAKISCEVGGVVLFGLFKPADTPYWDVLVSADWAGPERAPAIYYVAGKLQAMLEPEQLIQLSKVVPLLPSEEFVQSVLKDVRVDHGGVEFYHRVFNRLLFDEVYIITANPDNKPHAPLPIDAATFSAGARTRRPSVGSRAGRRSAPRPEPA